MFACGADGLRRQRAWLSQSRRSFVCTSVTALVEPESTIRSARRLRLRRGLSAEEVAELFDELGAPLLSWFRREVSTRDEAADLWSETWARVVASRSKIRGSTRGEHAAFVYTTARNLLADWRRRGLVEQRALAQLGIAPLRIENDLPALDAPVVLAHLEQLPEDQREAVRLRVIEELDYDEIAARTGATEASVRQRVSRGLKWLRGRMDGEERR
jgi:RNA polymerase sigma-70 factor (ECF subfamily)